MFDELLDANQHYAKSFSLGDLTNRSHKQLAFITCMDVRIEPLSLFNLDVGDANVLRNAAGRVTPDVLRSLVLATTLLGVKQVIVLHHSDCALSNTTDEQTKLRIADLGISIDPTFALCAMPDPEAALSDDVNAIVSSNMLPAGLLVAGWNYDPATGLVAEIVSPIEKVN